MASVGSEYFKAVFLKRRALLMTLPPILVKVAQWLVNQMARPAGDLKTAHLWEPSWEVWTIALMVGFAIAQFFAWREYFEKHRELVEGFPQIILAERAIEVEPFFVRVRADRDTIYTLGPYRALRVRIGNRPLVNTEKSTTNVNARINFYDQAGQRLCVMDGRWADSPQLSERDAARDYVAELAAPFPAGAERSIDVMFQRPGESKCVAVNNDNFRGATDLSMPGRDLNGIVRIVIELNGVYVKSRIFFSVSCDDLRVLEEAKIENDMP
jgi:hypothetical protein